MANTFSASDLKRINQKIADRQDVFYWQTDRGITPQEAGIIWTDRHGYFTDEDIIEAVNQALDGKDTVANLEPFKEEAQTNLGNVNSVRIATLASGQTVVIRCHPRGICNGYFYAESLASETARKAGLPAYSTLAIHDAADETDFAFQVCEKLPGTAVQKWLEQHPDDEPALLLEMGKCLAKLHQLTVTGFGPFDNTKAKQGDLVGVHKTFAQAVRAGLPFNLQVLTERDILTAEQATAIDKLLALDNPLLGCTTPVLVHNDFADWNMLTDGKQITGMIDWDECVGGDAVSDIACWSTFFDPSRLDGMLKGYWHIATKPADFDEKFELLRLRYTISKMTLRVRRYEWFPDESVRKRIETGKIHLAASLKYFKI